MASGPALPDRRSPIADRRSRIMMTVAERRAPAGAHFGRDAGT
jgi:hypothetical protein